MTLDSQSVTDVRKRRSSNVLRAVVCFLLVLPTEPIFGQGMRGVIDDLLRGTTRVSDDIPVKNVDDLIADISKSKAAREAVDTELRKGGRIVEESQLAPGVARSDMLLRLMRSANNGLDPTVLRRIENLDGPSREVAFVLAKGGDELAKTVPDIARRGRLVRAGGAETVAAVGMFGPDAARAALRLDEAIQGGAVLVKDGTRAVSVADFGNIMTRYGDASWGFWKQYVQPHWKVWAASGALAAYLANPEYFQDMTGKLTEEGFKRLGEFVGEVVASGIRGIGEGAKTAGKDIGGSLSETYLERGQGFYAAIGTIAIALCVSLLFRRIRHWAMGPFRWLNQAPGASKTSKR